MSLGQTDKNWDVVVRCMRAIYPKMEEVFTRTALACTMHVPLVGHRNVICPRSVHNEQRTPMRSGSGNAAKRPKAVASDLTAILPQMNMFRTDAAENENVTNSFIIDVVCTKLKNTYKPPE